MSATVAYAQAAGPACTREELKGLNDKFFQALETHNPSILPLASNVRYTENGKDVAMGKGFFETAGKPLLRRSLLDTQKCGTHTQAVMEEKFSSKTVAPPPPAAPATAAMPGPKPKPRPAEGTLRPILYGFRLKVENGKISEIETIIARESEFAFNVDGVLETKDQDWETILPPAQRSSRMAMIAAANDYFDMFAQEPMVHTPFASPCDRWENGTQTTKGGPFQGKDYVPHDCSPKGLVITNHGPRRFLVDPEAGIVVAYVHFAGGLPDFHMFKMRNGRVELVQAVIGAGAKSIGWPIEPVCLQ
jgi:hypothetical protein